MTEFRDDGICFVCGPKNSQGLRLDFQSAGLGQGVMAEVIFGDHFQGWQGVVHGGLQATVLDEAMIKAAAVQGLTCVTAEMTTSYLEPVRTGQRYRVWGNVIEARGRLVRAESQIVAENSRTCCRAQGKLLTIKI